MLKDSELITFITCLVDLLNRKNTYENIICEKEKIIQNLGIEHKDAIPAYPKINYSFSKGRLFLKVIGFSVISWLSLGLLTELVGLISKSAYKSMTIFVILLFPFLGIGLAVLTECLDKRSAKIAADLSFKHAVETVLKQHNQDDLKVESELKRADEIRSELPEWQKKLDFINEIIGRSMEFADIAEEYCSIEILLIFIEYLHDGKCSTIYECMLKFDETMRIMKVVNGLQEIRNRIDEFENIFSEAVHRADSYFRQQNEEAKRLCRQQTEILEDIDYNQETTKKGLFMLSMLD